VTSVDATVSAAGESAAAPARLGEDVYNAVMLFEPNAIEIAMSELRRVLRAEARHASRMRRRAGKLSHAHIVHLDSLYSLDHL